MSDNPGTGSETDLRNSALFAQMIIQQANMALMLMGHTPDPQSGNVTKDLEASGYFIDQLEMLEAKTKGNLSKQEADLLKQSLTSLRMAFVEAVEDSKQTGSGTSQAAAAPGASETSSQASSQGQPAPQEAPKAEAEDKKKFTKKY